MTNTTERYVEEIPFPIHIYRKQELAMLYFPDSTKEAASRNLRRWIEKCSQLHEALQNIGYDKNRKFFLRNEVKLIVIHLGEP